MFSDYNLNIFFSFCIPLFPLYFFPSVLFLIFIIFFSKIFCLFLFFSTNLFLISLLIFFIGIITLTFLVFIILYFVLFSFPVDFFSLFTHLSICLLLSCSHIYSFIFYSVYFFYNLII